MAKKPVAASKEEPAVSRIIKGQKAFAKHCGVTTKTVQNWQDGELPFTDLGGNKYEYDLDLTEPWVATFHAKSAKDPEALKVRSQREDARLRLDLVDAEVAEMDLAARKGNILPRDEYELFLIEHNMLVRDSMLAIPKQMRRHLGPNSQKILHELERLINKALEHLADKGKRPQE